MANFKSMLSRYGPAAALMAGILVLSGRPADELPRFGWADALIKKGGHVLGYGILALTYWRALEWRPRASWTAWLLAVLYAATDELHQAGVPGRNASIVDIALFDSLGAALALWMARRLAASKPERRATQVDP